MGFSLQAGLHPRREGASVRTGTSRFGRSWQSSHPYSESAWLEALNRVDWPKCPEVTPGSSTSWAAGLCSGYIQLPAPLPISPDRPPYLASGLLGTDTTSWNEARIHLSSASVLGKQTLSRRKLDIPGLGLGRKKKFQIPLLLVLMLKLKLYAR